MRLEKELTFNKISKLFWVLKNSPKNNVDGHSFFIFAALKIRVVYPSRDIRFDYNIKIFMRKITFQSKLGKLYSKL